MEIKRDEYAGEIIIRKAGPADMEAVLELAGDVLRGNSGGLLSHRSQPPEGDLMVVRPLLLHGDTDQIIIPFFPKKHKAGLLLFAAFPPGPRRARLSAPPWKNAGPLAVFRCVSLKRVIE